MKSSYESQSNVQFNLQSLGENKTGYHAVNIKIFSTDENFKKRPHFFTLLFYSLLITYRCATQC